jgi:hypothetical protein
MYKIFTIFTIAIILYTGKAFALDENPTTTSANIDTSSIEEIGKTWISSTKEFIEVFRIKQAQYFINLRDTTKVKLGIKVSDDILEKINETLSPPPAPTPIPGTEQGDGLYFKKVDNPIDYGTLILATALASLFSSILMFYGISIILAFFILRFIFRMFI